MLKKCIEKIKKEKTKEMGVLLRTLAYARSNLAVLELVRVHLRKRIKDHESDNDFEELFDGIQGLRNLFYEMTKLIKYRNDRSDFIELKGHLIIRKCKKYKMLMEKQKEKDHEAILAYVSYFHPYDSILGQARDHIRERIHDHDSDKYFRYFKDAIDDLFSLLRDITELILKMPIKSELRELKHNEADFELEYYR